MSTPVVQVPHDARVCRWCRSAPVDVRAIYCSQRCRQAAWRVRRLHQASTTAAEPGVFAYADPPYPGTARRYYQHEASYAGEVDHRELVASLGAAGYTGWALWTSAKALRDVLPLCPEGARVCPWVKPHGASPLTYGIHNCWEPLIVVGGRQRRPGVRDWLSALPARHGGELPGRKPLAFCAWLFRLLGMQPGDQVVDLFPGTGVVSRAWAELSSRAALDDTSSSCSDDGRGVSADGMGDTSAEYSCDGGEP